MIQSLVLLIGGTGGFLLWSAVVDVNPWEELKATIRGEPSTRSTRDDGGANDGMTPEERELRNELLPEEDPDRFNRPSDHAYVPPQEGGDPTI